MKRCGGTALGLAVGLLVSPGTAPAQEDPIPHFPFGTPVIVLPVQAVTPLPDGSWPGRARSEEDALRNLDAELAFALGERRGAEEWIFPPDLARSLSRNPMFSQVDPERLAYQGLLTRPDKRKILYDPLHSELRSLAALFDTRYLILPVSLRVEPAVAGEGDFEAAAAAGTGELLYRAMLVIALIDIRSSTVVWYGEIGGDPSALDSGALVATLAQRLAKAVTL